MNSLISCRVRLARNVKGLPFPHRMDEAARRRLIDLCSDTLTRAADGREFEAIYLGANNRTQAGLLVEQHLISPEFAADPAPRAVALSRDRTASVMICEEDHLRIQTFGGSFEPCLEKARQIDALLDERMPMAFADKLGFLTACPTNLGTALRASAMLHLPCLAENGQIAALSKQMQSAGLGIRGMYGEGSRTDWGYFQISNAVSMGFTESELCTAVWDIALRLDSLEAESRRRMQGADPVGFADRVWRAWGLLQNARRITTTEAMEALSRLRVGCLAGETPCSLEQIDKLTTAIWPAHMIQQNNANADNAKRGEARAALLKGALSEG